MNIIWSESRIRDEIKRLDQKTGLCGAELPIVFDNRKQTLGSFSVESGKAKMFRFSIHYFQNPDFPVEEAVDCIRHEYAHYLDFMLNGKLGHSSTWKQCCIRVGAMPTRLYSEGSANYYREKHEREHQLNSRVEAITSGVSIWHPQFGAGTVLSRSGEGRCSVVQAMFPAVGQKTLAAVWVLNNCECNYPGKKVS